MTGQGFGYQRSPKSERKFLSLAGKELFQLSHPDEESELEREAKRQFQIVEELNNQFEQACGS